MVSLDAAARTILPPRTGGGYASLPLKGPNARKTFVGGGHERTRGVHLLRPRRLPLQHHGPHRERARQ